MDQFRGEGRGKKMVGEKDKVASSRSEVHPLGSAGLRGWRGKKRVL